MYDKRYSESERVQNSFHFRNIQLFRQRLSKKSVRDNAERQSGKYSINFNKLVNSSESILFLLTHANKYS